MVSSAADKRVNEGPGSPPLLSKTCQNCYHLKIRCDRTQQGPTCDRCRRLGKNCVYRPARRRYKSAKRDGRIEALESKIDELMRSRASSPMNDDCDDIEGSRNSLASTSSSGSSNSFTSIDVIEEGLLTMEQGNNLLSVYKSRLTAHFPFVVIPPQMSAEILKKEKPFLFLSVLASSSFHDMPLQRRLGDIVMKTINQRIIKDNTTSFELLQGILVFLAWSHYHQRCRRYSQILQLAISIVSDLRLDRSPMNGWENHLGGCVDPQISQDSPNERSSDEKRALAGCFYLSSTVSKLLQKLNAFPYTRYLEECCMSLRDQYEYPTDEYLFHVIRLQRIMEAIDYMTQQNCNGPTAKAATIDLRSQLDSFRSHLPFDLAESQLLFMQYRTAELYLCQAAQFSKTLQLDAVGHVELLSSGLAATRSLLDYYLGLPIYADTAMNNTEWLQISFAITVTTRLTSASGQAVMDNPQIGALRQSLDLSGAIGNLCLRVNSLTTQQVDSKGDRDTFHYYKQRLQRMLDWYERNSGPSALQTTKVGTQPQPQLQLQTQMPSLQQHQELLMSTAPTSALLPAATFGGLEQIPRQLPGSAGNTICPITSAPVTTTTEIPVQFFHDLAIEPYTWSTNTSRANTPDMNMADMLSEQDYAYSDLMASLIET